MLPDDYTSVRHWRRKPPLRLRVTQDQGPGEPGRTRRFEVLSFAVWDEMLHLAGGRA